MADFIKHINNVETGEITVEPLTNDETELREKEIAEAILAKEAKAAEAQAKAAQKAALLERLGITEDEARLLLA
jgi:hypothetical protein